MNPVRKLGNRRRGIILVLQSDREVDFVIPPRYLELGIEQIGLFGIANFNLDPVFPRIRYDTSVGVIGFLVSDSICHSSKKRSRLTEVHSSVRDLQPTRRLARLVVQVIHPNVLIDHATAQSSK